MNSFSASTSNRLLLSIALLVSFYQLKAQQKPGFLDTPRHQILPEISVISTPTKQLINTHFAAPVDGTTITAGRKTEIINPSALNANLSQNNMRQVLAAVPGLMVWENDGSGQQINIATRGLSPNRSWEFNVRQNGYDVSADAFGYPEAYYAPPLEAIDRIQLIRGSSGLQFGPQFGGLLNYELKRGATNKKVQIEARNTVGSNGLYNTYNAIGGTIKNVQYYAYYRHRQGAGWRTNNQYTVDDVHANVNIGLTKRLNLNAEITYATNQMQQPGGLTDAQFAQDARQSNRARNWLTTPWLVPALTLDYKANANTRITLKTFGLVAARNSVGFVAGLPTPDTANRNTGQYANRQVDSDEYRNLGTELRLTHNFMLLGQRHTLAAGLRAYQANTYRRQRGIGSNGDDLNLNLTTSGLYANRFSFTTNNASAFTEILLQATTRLSITPGVRLEYLQNKMNGMLGRLANGTNNNVPDQISTRKVLLYGIGAQYEVTAATNLYANYARAYRPVLFSDLVPPATTDVIDPNLKDASGFTSEIGYRGSYKQWLRFDVGYFILNYQDRIGTIRQAVTGGAVGQTQQFRTNLGNSITHGLEAFTALDLIKAVSNNPAFPSLDLFASLSMQAAQYTDQAVTTVIGTGANTQIVETNLKGNTVENAPGQTIRTGLTFAQKGLSVTAQFSYVGRVYTDANNTQIATPNGQAGPAPAYKVTDLSATYKVDRKGRFVLSGGVNNILDARYFTRRAGGYPGPGLLPADGRTWYAGLAIIL